jgi:hypothetical protein
MRLRNILTATAVTALLIGVVSTPAHADTAPPAANAGSVVAWGDEDYPGVGPAIPVPGDLRGPVVAVDATGFATGVVSLTGEVRVWGDPNASEVSQAPTGITDATTITLAPAGGAVLHATGKITAWGGSTALSQVPTDLRARAFALQTSSGVTGYAVRPDGTLTTWGDAPYVALPTSGLTDLVDVSASPTHVLALHTDGTLTTWGIAIDDLLDVPDFGDHKVVKIEAGYGVSSAILDDGTVTIWGEDRAVPAGQPSFDGSTPSGKVVNLSLGQNPGGPDGVPAAAVTADGVVHVWGPRVEAEPIPTSLVGQPVATVAVGFAHVAAVVTAFRDLTKPTITGTATVGQTLTATPATFSLAPDAPSTSQWYADSDPIAGETGTTLTLDSALVGKSVSYRTTASRDNQTVTSTSAPLGPVVPEPIVPAPGVPTTTVPTPTVPAPSLPEVKAGSSVTGKAKVAGKTKKVAKRVTFSLSVLCAKGVSPAGKMTVTLVGQTKKKVTTMVNASGRATVTIKKVKRGKYTATFNYAGNDSVSGSAGSVKFKV